MKKVISTVMAMVCLFTSTAFAKSDSWIDYNIDKMREMLYQEDFRVYAESSADNSVYYGAKFEPKSGTIIGTPYNCGIDGVGNGIDTHYEWFYPSENLKNANVPREAVAEVKSDHTKLVGWNWNFASKVPVDFNEYENYIKNYIDALAARGDDILLVFGKEMNIDDNFLDEQVFIDCFRYVADYAHTKENIAMVWAPNDTGGLDTRLIDFYPGDEYVDWIGCSLYSMPYFTGDKNASEGSNIGFIMGPYQNPVMRAKVIHDFMVENNIKKPVFITEGGVGYESPDGEKFTDWAIQQVRRYYGELIRVFPEFKCIVAFNNYVEVGDYYRYDMGNEPALLQTLQSMCSDPIFITDYTKPSDISYVEMYDGMTLENSVKLSAYGYMPKVQWMTVKYIVDGTEVCSTEYPPYKFEIKNLSEGTHSLTTEFYVGGVKMKTLNSSFNFKKTANRVYNDVADDGSCTFTDMNGMSAEMRNAVGNLAKKGVISGVGDNKFAPNAEVTRAEISAMLVRALDLQSGEAAFKDVSKDKWYYSSVAAAKEAGLLDGFEDGTFRPDNGVTNEQVVAIMAKYFQKNGTTVPNLSLNFDDTVNSWAQDFVRIGMDKGIVINYDDNTFKGEAKVTRGDCAVMINRFLNAQ